MKASDLTHKASSPILNLVHISWGLNNLSETLPVYAERKENLLWLKQAGGQLEIKKAM